MKSGAAMRVFCLFWKFAFGEIISRFFENNSRFGEKNSRLGRQREFVGRPLFIRGFFGRFGGLERRNPGIFPANREFAFRGGGRSVRAAV
jgi:hypothetical protein